MKKRITARSQIIKILLTFIILIFVLLFVVNAFAIREFNSGLVTAGQDIIRNYKNLSETEIRTMQNYIIDIVSNDTDFQRLVYADNDTDTYARLQTVSEKFKKMQGLLTGGTGYIIYNSASPMMKEVYLPNHRFRYSEKEQFKEILRTQVEEVRSTKWQIRNIEGSFYLMCIYGKGNAYIMGIYDLNTVLGQQDGRQDTVLFFTDDALHPLTDGEDVAEKVAECLSAESSSVYMGGRYLVVREELDGIPLNIVYVMVFRGMGVFLYGYPAFAVAATLAVVFLCLYTLQRLRLQYLEPFKSLVETMKKITAGDSDAKMDEDSNIAEFHDLATAFNSMMEKIKVLKIASYESKLETQRTKIQYYQAQIRPHFFLNCFKNMYALAETGRYQKLQQMVLALSRQFYYIMRDSSVMCTVKSELENVENYIMLQQLVFSSEIQYKIEAGNETEGCGILPLSILTFVENAVKHAQRKDKPLMIQIKLTLWEDEGEELLEVMVLDNGKGFPEDALRGLNSGENSGRDGHIGIYNVRQRFHLQFQEKATFIFSNMDGSGACVQFFYPRMKCDESEFINCR